MKMLNALCATALVLGAFTGCGTAPAPTPPDTHDADVKAISDLETQWNKDWAAKDVDKIAANYADDAVVMNPGMDAIHGKDAIRSVLKQMTADSKLSLSFQAAKVDVAKSGDIGYTQGSYKMTVSDPTTHKVMNDHGSYVTTYRKQPDGSWKAVADIATSDLPAMPVPKKK